ncbi:MAG: HAMP domain-containing protein [Betaproteobacteria bacterium]|nr:HAMP domain-containing protein [Betaproteobacteria bacterium]
MNFWQRFDPRLHLAAAVGWTVFVIGTAAAYVVGSLAGDVAEQRVTDDTELLLSQFADQIGRGVAAHLRTRLAVIEATAAQMRIPSHRDPRALERHVQAIQRHFPEFAWIGVTDAAGRVLGATGRAHEGQDVSAQRWFTHSRDGPWLGDVHVRAAGQVGPGSPVRVLDIAAPILSPDNVIAGRVGAHLSWRWVDHLLSDMVRAVATHRALDVILLSGDGTPLIAPEGWPPHTGKGAPAVPDFSEGGRYLVSRDVTRQTVDGPGPAWTLVVREPANEALADAVALRHVVFELVFTAGLLSVLGAALIARRLMHRLERLAEGADKIRAGERRELEVPEGRDEVSRIGATLGALVTQLQAEKSALEQLNADLDAKVAERTLRIERLAEESKQAAVVRERLRMARELHDTLAHSLMALLAQIRLVRKLGPRVTTDELDQELASAEEAAATGLREARAAIMQMRHNAVRDTGLGNALKELLARFGERTGIAHECDIDSQAGTVADERAEAVFRIVEEALHNVERHAQAHHVEVRVRWLASGDGHVPGESPARVHVEVADDGVGFDPAVPRPGHYGLRGIAEQIDLIGASLRMDSRPGAGTRLEIEYAV